MHLPPQAYTKETLIQAYNWLRSQPASIQELAKSPDSLVSLYSKSQIHGENYLSRTNLQSFKTELKSLANIMGDLDSQQGEQTQTNLNTNPNLSSNRGLNLNNSGPLKTDSNNSNFNFNSNPNSLQLNPNQSSNQPIGSSTINTGNANQINNLNGASNSNHSLTPVATEKPYPYLNSLLSTNLNSNQNQEMLELRTILDPRSWGMLQEVKNHLNLSSESEALRLLLSLGYQKIRPQF